MKTFVISALALGAMTSVALAEEPLTQTGPVQLSLSQMDDVTAGRRINVDVAIIKARQSNKAEVWAGVFADDVKGNCNNCTVLVDGSAHVDQSNDIDVDQ